MGRSTPLNQAQIPCLPLHQIWQIYQEIYPPVEASSGKEWQLKTSIVKAHIGRSVGRSTPPIYPDEVFYAKDLLPVRVTI